MNLEKVFNFIKEKRGYNIPIRYKLINGLPLSDDELNIKGNLNLYNTNIESLPDNLQVGGHLYLGDSNIKSLPDNLYVGSDLILHNTNIKSLPNNLQVGWDLYLYSTPLSKKYSKEEIRKMIEDKGGFVKGDIYL